MLTTQHRQEALSRAYIRAIAALAGMSVSTPEPDYGTDLTLYEIEARRARRKDSGRKLDVQAKCTIQAQVDAACLRYDLDIRGYEYLRDTNTWCPRILVVLVLPPDERDWWSQSESALSLHRCAYWLSLRGAASVQRRQSIRVEIPRTNVFSPAAIKSLLLEFDKGQPS